MTKATEKTSHVIVTSPVLGALTVAVTSRGNKKAEGSGVATRYIKRGRVFSVGSSPMLYDSIDLVQF
jgi:hypothetical protein